MNTVEQDFPTYFQAHLQASRMSSADEVLAQIVQCNKLQFTLTEVSFEDFKAKRTVDNVKSYNVPYFAVNFFRGIVHLALGIIRSRAEVYTGIRELQEGWGRLVSMINSEKGAYYIERSKFHKDAYSYFVKNYNAEQHFFEFRLLESQRFNLLDLKKDPETFIKKFNLEETVAKLDKRAFLEKIAYLDEELLSLVSISEFKSSAVTLNTTFLISDTEFAKLSIKELYALSQLGHNQGYLIERTNRFKKQEGEEVQENSYLDITTRDNIQEMLVNFPPSLNWLFSDEQLLKADFTQLNETQLSWILVGSRTKIRELVAKVPKETLGPEFYTKCSPALPFLSDDQIRNLTKLNVGVIRKVLSRDLIYTNLNEYLRRYSLLPISELQANLPYFDQQLAGYISEDQLKQLDFAWIKNLAQFNLFFGGEGQEKRIQVLSANQIASIALFFSTKHSLNISNETIKKIDFRGLDIDETLNVLFRHDEAIMKARLDLLEPMQLLYALRHLSIGFVKLISDNQIKNLPFNEMDGFDVRRVFDTRFGEDLTRRFNLVPEKVQGMLKHLEGGLLYIPENILKTLDLSELNSIQLNLLLGTKKRIELLTEDQLKTCVDRLEGIALRILPEETLLKNLDKFSDKQLAEIFAFRKTTFEKIPEDKRNTIITRINT